MAVPYSLDIREPPKQSVKQLPEGGLEKGVNTTPLVWPGTRREHLGAPSYENMEQSEVFDHFARSAGMPIDNYKF